MKKRVAIVLGILLSVLLLNLVHAINLEVSVKPVSDSFIIDFNEPAVFDLVIKNLEDTDDFEIYSLVGVEILPKTTYRIIRDETKTIRINLIPQEALRSKIGFSTFEYLIKNSEGQIQRQRLSVNIIDLENAILVTPENIDTKSENIKIFIKNTIMYDFNDLKISMSSAFFNYEKDFPLKALESQELLIPLDKEKLKTLDAGKYLITTRVSSKGKTSEKEVVVKFLEEENIESNELREGILVRRTEMSKNNIGNVKKRIVINAERNLISSLFTSVNIVPGKTEIKGFKKYYTWEKELGPGEQLKIIVKTNWLYPILIIILIIIVILLIRRYIRTDLILRKNVSFVKTKGGEFALKIHLKVKARRFVERIKITDKLPQLVSLYEKYGAVAPDNVDLKNKRIEWNIEALNPGEERIFSYIIYSKVGVVGRFELPVARAIYEKEGQIKDADSNRAFFINEPKSNKI